MSSTYIAMDVVYIHGCTCRYVKNATNVLVFSENTREHTSDIFDRSFKLVRVSLKDE